MELLFCMYVNNTSTLGSVIQIGKTFYKQQWRTQEFCSGGGSTNSVEDRENGDLGAVVPSQGFWRQL